MPSHQLTRVWPQAVIEFADRYVAEQVAVTHLRPELANALADGSISCWFFTRKSPCWRLRYVPADGRVRRHLSRVLDGWAAERRIVRWTVGLYEPEVFAFGGVPAMEVAHELFHQDSRNILDHLGRTELGRRELTILLCSVLLRSAGLDWFEQGDVWARVLHHRSAGTAVVPGWRPSPLRAMYRLMTIDASPTSALFDGGPLAAMHGWFAAFERAGQRLADLARRGSLKRGLRAVLAHHVIFHWNRLGLSYTEQRTLAALAKEVVMAEQDEAASAPSIVTRRDESGSDAAKRLRNALVDRLRVQGTVRSERVEAALRAVPRHLFVPGVPLEEAYADDPVYTKHDGTGASISAASQPTIVAMMLEQLQAEPGEHVLEIGAGTGYNAGLLAHLVGEAGRVTTVDVDEDIVVDARSGLAAAGLGSARVVLGDGALGCMEDAPYDRIIATVGAWDLPREWLTQLAPAGRLVVPLRLRGSVCRSIVFQRYAGHLRSRSSSMCTFMPLRGIADDPRRTVALTPDAAVGLHTHQEQPVEAAALHGVLAHPPLYAWTGVLFGAAESFEWLDLWLTCTMDSGLSRMVVQRPAVQSGLVRPQFGWGAMAATDTGSLAYLTLRPAGHRGIVACAGRLYEVGVIGHGPSDEELVDRMMREIQTWDREYRSRTVTIELQPAGAPERIEGQFTFDTPNNRLAISWE